MHRQHLAVIDLIGLLVFLAVGCSRMSAVEETEVRQSFGIPADMPLKALGVVELRVGTPKRVTVDSGKDCTFTAIVLTNGRVDLNMLYESRGEVLDGVKTESYSERSGTVLPPGLLASAMKSKSWLCFPLKRPHFVIAIQPVIIP
jgi:hypothetical protein